MTSPTTNNPSTPWKIPLVKAAEMNGAPADKKLDAVVTVLNKLVQQRKAMHEQMQKMTSVNEKQGMCMCR